MADALSVPFILSNLEPRALFPGFGGALGTRLYPLLLTRNFAADLGIAENQ